MKKSVLWIVIISSIVTSFNFTDSTASYYKAKALPGDGAYALLRRYSLLNECNVEKFYEINQLDNRSNILAGRKYLLPVYIYTYNGTSIRSTLGINDLEKAKRIKAYNEMLKEKNLRSQTIEESNILWVPFHELYCMEERIEAAKASNKYMDIPLFGKEHQRVNIIDQSLKNKVFYVVSGHGGPDPGANTKINGHFTAEDEYAYDVGLRLAKKLMEHGAIVEMVIQDSDDGIRNATYLNYDKDERCNGERLPVNQKKRLAQRTDYINQRYYHYRKKGISDQKVLSIHVDSHAESHQVDVYFFHARGSNSGRQVATNLKNTFEQKYNQYQRGRGYKGVVKEGGWYIIKNTTPPAVLVELGNIKNVKDHKRILSPRNRQYLAEWLYEGLTK